MIICCPICKKQTELEHVERGRHIECVCHARFALDDVTVLQDYSGIDAKPPEQIGPYQIERFIGRGGMGRVYKGKHPTLVIPVAVKVLSPELADNKVFQERFIKSARICAKIDHPNVVKVYDFDKGDDGNLYLVMEYIAGGTLFDLLMRSGPLTPQKTADIAIAICQALSAAQKNGVVHRDIKPDNIMISSDGEYKLADLGLAKYEPPVDKKSTSRITESMKEETLELFSLGTPEYMAPEQAFDAEHCDIRADIYSLGMTMYQLLSGHLPFEAKNREELRRMHLEEEPRIPGVYRPDIPIDLEYIVMRCIQKRKVDRYQTPEELQKDLEAFVQGLELPSTNDETLALTVARDGGFLVPVREVEVSYVQPWLTSERKFWIAVGVIACAVLFFTILPDKSGKEVAREPEIPAPPPVIYDRDYAWKNARSKAIQALETKKDFANAILNLNPFENDEVESIRKEAGNLLVKLKRAEEQEVKKLMTQLDKAADQFSKEHDYNAAIAVYEEETRLVHESRSRRQERIAVLKKKQAEYQELSRMTREFLVKEVIPLLAAKESRVSQNYTRAREAYERKTGILKDARFVAILKECAGIPAAFANLMQKHVNQEVQFLFSPASEPLYSWSKENPARIQLVQSPYILLHNSNGKKFTILDLQLEEQERELLKITPLSQESRALWCTGIALQNDPRNAKRYMMYLPEPLKEPYGEYITQRIEEHRDTMFRDELRRLFSDIGYSSVDLPYPEQLPRMEIFYMMEPAQILGRLDTILLQYEDLKSARQYLEALRQIRNNVQERRAMPPETENTPATTENVQ